jgi:hypothetical protein
MKLADSVVGIGYIRGVSDFLLDYPYGSHDRGVLVGFHLYERRVHSSDVCSISSLPTPALTDGSLGMAPSAHVAHLRLNSQISATTVSSGVIVSGLTLSVCS